jgi:TRAP-type mannitol/chloroaromatic compound transport system permease small subunit
VSTIRRILARVVLSLSDTIALRTARMTVQRFLYAIDEISTWVGKTTAWLIIVLMSVVCVEVFKRYILNAPTAWIFDLDSMLYGTLFMLCGAYTLAQNAHVRGDFLYSSMRPRMQALLDIVLYVVFFLPGVAALIYAGYDYASLSWHINEHSNVTAEGPPVYHFKTVIPIAGALILLQGIAEIVRCVVCLKTGVWPGRLKDVAEIDVIEQQLAHSEYVDDESRKLAIEQAQQIDETARQRGMGGDLNT